MLDDAELDVVYIGVGLRISFPGERVIMTDLAAECSPLRVDNESPYCRKARYVRQAYRRQRGGDAEDVLSGGGEGVGAFRDLATSVRSGDSPSLKDPTQQTDMDF